MYGPSPFKKNKSELGGLVCANAYSFHWEKVSLAVMASRSSHLNRQSEIFRSVSFTFGRIADYELAGLLSR
jgi:hypothetical protein